MPRIPRSDLQGTIFHVLNRGNARATVFHKDADYRAFINLLRIAKQRVPVKLYAFCILSNHFHAVVESGDVNTLSRFMHRWLNTHVRRYHRHYGTSGHIWQGRFKSFPIQCDEHFLTVARYVLRNPVRAMLVRHPMEWQWTSLRQSDLSDRWPVPPPPEFDPWLDQPLSDQELEHVRQSVNRQAPFGDPHWAFRVAEASGLLSSLRPRGRPPKKGTGIF